MKICVFFLTLTVSFSAFAQSRDCLPEADIAQLRKDFIFKLNTADVQSPLEMESCNSTSVTYKLLEALIFLKNLPALSSRVDDFNSNTIDVSPYEFLRKRTQFIFLEDPNSKNYHQCKSAGTMAWAERGSPNVMHVCPYVQLLPKLMISGMFIHESRHLDSEKFAHVPCMQGPLTGQFACDRSYEEKGAYAVETEFFIRVARTESLPQQLRDQARNYAQEELTYRFMKMPFDIKLGTLLVGKDSSLSFYDGKTIYPILDNPVRGDIVSLRTNTPVYFDKWTGDVLSYIGGSTWADTEGPMAQIFREFPIETRNAVLDMNYGGTACFLFVDKMICKELEDIVEVQLPQEMKAVKFVSMGNMPDGGELVMVLAEDGSLYSLPYNTPLSKWTPDLITVVTKLKGYLGLGLMPGLHRIAILGTGEFANFNESNNTYVANPNYKNQRFQKLISPFFWSPRFPEI